MKKDRRNNNNNNKNNNNNNSSSSNKNNSSSSNKNNSSSNNNNNNNNGIKDSNNKLINNSNKRKSEKDILKWNYWAQTRDQKPKAWRTLLPKLCIILLPQVWCEARFGQSLPILVWKWHHFVRSFGSETIENRRTTLGLASPQSWNKSFICSH